MLTPETRYYVFSRNSDNPWVVDEVTHNYISDRLQMFCETRIDEVIFFQNLSGIKIAIRISLIGELSVFDRASREHSYALNKAMEKEDSEQDLFE